MDTCAFQHTMSTNTFGLWCQVRTIDLWPCEISWKQWQVWSTGRVYWCFASFLAIRFCNINSDDMYAKHDLNSKLPIISNMFNLVICDTSVADSLQSEHFHWDLVSMTKPSPFPRHGSSPSHARCCAVHPAPSTWVSPKRSPKPWRWLRVQRLEPQQMGEKLGTDVSPTFPNRCIFRLSIYWNMFVFCIKI